MDRKRPIVFGEVLFDCFASRRTLGGAPFNVAWHLHGFGLNPLFVSRIGSDEWGEQIVERMRRWGMDTSGLQRDPQRATGKVLVSGAGDRPSFEIPPEQAYDSIEAGCSGLLAPPQDFAQIYHGTLILRSPVSAKALDALREETKLPVFVDVNLRPPWWDREKVMQAIHQAACIKLNEDELRMLAGSGDDLTALAEELKAQVRAEAVVVTRGAAGAFARTDEGSCSAEAARPRRFVDSVGAGDAFAAIAMLGMLRRWPWPRTLERAAFFAARVCEHRGAVRDDPDLYRKLGEEPSAG